MNKKIFLILLTILILFAPGCASTQPKGRQVKMGMTLEELKNLKKGDYLQVPGGYYKVLTAGKTELTLSDIFQKGEKARGKMKVFYEEAIARLSLDKAMAVNLFSDDGVMPEYKSMEQLQREFVDLRFGLFVHFGIRTYKGAWGAKNLPIKLFNPVKLDCGQWADAAKAAGMTFGVLTCKHHDGFALWDSSVSDFDVASIPWRNGKGDVVREFVDAFRSRGLIAGLYYSVWDNTEGIGNGEITGRDIDYVKQELKELLTNYGPVNVLIVDGWSWKMGHRKMPYGEIREYIRSLQPQCLVIDHTHLQNHYNNDIFVFEEPKGVFSPPGNKLAAAQDQKIIEGNGWFWGEQTIKDIPMSLKDIVEGHLIPLEKAYTTFILNCPPNRDGLLDDHIVKRLRQVGKAWKPDETRKRLPKQPPFNVHPITPQSATAASGEADKAVDGQNDAHYYSVWESDKSLPQSITVDFGKKYDNVNILCYVPKYVTTAKPTSQGAITSYKVYTSTDGKKFTKVKEGKWPANSKMKTAVFDPVKARYIRLEALEAKGGFAAATEITAGTAE